MKAAMIFLAGAALCVPAPACAADYPSKPVTLMIGFAPGGPSDVMARILTKKMEEILKQPLVIENRAGAGGSIAGAAVARAAPDGYTVLLATGSLLAINVSLYKNVGYDPEKDFEPIGLIGTQTNVLYLNPSVPAASLGELIAYAKANPGKLSFGSGGNGTPAHLAGELLKLEAKIDITHVPFRGTGPSRSRRSSERTYCPRSRASPSRAFPASRRRPGMHSWRRRGRRRTSSPRCIARLLRPSMTRRCAKP